MDQLDPELLPYMEEGFLKKLRLFVLALIVISILFGVKPGWIPAFAMALGLAITITHPAWFDSQTQAGVDHSLRFIHFIYFYFTVIILVSYGLIPAVAVVFYWFTYRHDKTLYKTVYQRLYPDGKPTVTDEEGKPTVTDEEDV